MYSFRESKAPGSKLALCGTGGNYQVQIQDALNSEIRLLVETPDPSIAPDADLAKLAREVNDFFEGKAHALLLKKRKELADAGQQDVAARSEVTAFLTDRGIQIGFSHALEHKEVAPTPHKSLLRSVLGPLSLGRAKWTMPLHSGTPGVHRKVWWPWLFWALLAVAAVLLVWFTSNGMLYEWTHAGSAAGAGNAPINGTLKPA